MMEDHHLTEEHKGIQFYKTQLKKLHLTYSKYDEWVYVYQTLM